MYKMDWVLKTCLMSDLILKEICGIYETKTFGKSKLNYTK